jgi:hypothetical protein
MINLLAVAVLASNSIVPCATIAEHHTAASADVIMHDALDSVEVEEALILAEENFAAHVGDLGLAGAAPLFGTQPVPAVETARQARRDANARGAKNQRLSAARTPRP